jgi:hypothetical protein
LTALAAVAARRAPPARDVATDKAKLEADATSWFGFYARPTVTAWRTCMPKTRY